MKYDVFISYSHKDKQTADAVCAKLEQQGIRCWYAPRDITPGADWAESIINAIETVRVMIIIFTDHSNASKQVMNEISNAVNAGVTIVPFKLTNTAPSKGMQYYFTAVHWLDAVDKPMKSSIEELCTRVEGILSLNRSDEPERTKPQTPAPEAIRKHFSAYLQELRDAPKADGQDRIYTHGEKEVFAYAERMRDGIDVNINTVAEMADMARYLDMDVEKYLGRVDVKGLESSYK